MGDFGYDKLPGLVHERDTQSVIDRMHLINFVSLFRPLHDDVRCLSSALLPAPPTTASFRAPVKEVGSNSHHIRPHHPHHHRLPSTRPLLQPSGGEARATTAAKSSDNLLDALVTLTPDSLENDDAIT